MSTFKANNHAWDGTVQVLSSNDFSRDFQLPGEEIKETEKHDAGNERKFNDAEAKKWFFELPQVSNFISY